MRPLPLAALAAHAFILASAPALAAQQPARLSDEVRQYVAVDAPVVALTNVRVLDGTGAPAAEAQTIIIEGGRIAAVGPAAQVRPPAGAHVVDLGGHTVIPGLVGMHDHTFYTTSARSVQLSYSAPRLYLASGITTIRTTGAASPYAELNLKRSIEQGRAPGPRMFVTGPYINGPSGSSHMRYVDAPEDARRVVAYWAEEGASWFKAYAQISRAELKAAIDEAHRRGLKVTGHLCSVSFREAVALGIDNLEHGFFTNSDWDPEKQPDACPAGMRGRMTNLEISSPEVQQTIREMVGNGVAMTSTLAVYELFVPDRPPLEQRVLDAMSPETRDEYMRTREALSRSAATSEMPVVFRKAQEFELAFARAGGLLAAGVDPTGIGGALPGFGDQRNYELLIEAGFTPAEAIRVMSLNGAKVLGIDGELGSIAQGKKADLVVIRGNPVATHADIRNVTVVFKDGIGYDSAKLIADVKGLVGIR